MAEILGVTASALAVVELSAKIALLCTQYLKDVSKAKKDVERLQQEVLMLGEVTKGRSALENCQSRLEELQKTSTSSKTEAKMSKSGLRALKWSFRSKAVEKVIQDVVRFKQAISLALQVDQTNAILSMDQKMVLAKLPIAEGATFDSHAEEHNARCLPETRIDLLHEITQWAEQSHARNIYWLNGMAGTGKSTISRTVAHKILERNALGLVSSSREVKVIVEVIETDPAIFSKAMREQFDTLVVEPLLKISASVSRTLLIVIEALDECEREEDAKLLIKILSSTELLQLQQITLKFFLTSRPELPIRLGFKAVYGTYGDFILHEIDEPVIERDIAAFLNHELRQVRHNYNEAVPVYRQLPGSWPNAADLQILVKMAISLFIFAATTCWFIADQRIGSPDEQLKEVLRYQTKSQESQLDATYSCIESGNCRASREEKT